MIFLVLFIICYWSASTVAAQEQISFHGNPLPSWPERFSVKFYENSSGLIPFGNMHQTSGSYYYDYPNRKQKVTRLSGKYDRYCSSVRRNTESECHQLITEGKRWIIFPQDQYCCMCCKDHSGCGMLKPTWLKDAKYLREEECLDVESSNKSNDTCLVFDQPGLQSNYYWQEKDSGVPRRIFQLPNDDQVFIPSSFTQESIDPDTFTIPQYCFNPYSAADVKCPLLSVCSLLQ